MTPVLAEFFQRHQARIETHLAALFDTQTSYDTRLLESMRYSLLSGGKRIRPLLVYASADACSDTPTAVDDFACAVECVHCYSLIHDDLPAMDDDELRRGMPTNHIAFDEATAILAGDALQCLAFETLSQAACSAQNRISAIQALSRASGAQGMVMGQAIDLHAVDTHPDLAVLERMHLHKTGALIEASIVLGAIAANASTEQIGALRIYARAIGLAFQVQDDILDVTSDTATLGKHQGADAERNKPTYVSLLGLSQAQEKAQALCDEAIAALAPFGERGKVLRELAHYIVQRQH